jgi:phosphoribosyl-AMP cyclohydrolase
VPFRSAKLYRLLHQKFMLDFDKANGLIAAIAQDAESGEVLMIAWMNRAAFEETLATGRAVYFSRSRNKLWRKGEESGHFQEVVEVLVDCDADAVLLKVRQVGGAACHEGYKSCFFRKLEGGAFAVVGAKVFDPKAVYAEKGSKPAATH